MTELFNYLACGDVETERQQLCMTHGHVFVIERRPPQCPTVLRSLS